MKCPYRKIIETKHQYNADITTERFCECYERECPFYTPLVGLMKRIAQKQEKMED